jgi:hypothetical protein
MISQLKKKISTIGILLLISFLFSTLNMQINFATAQDTDTYEIVPIPCPSLEGSIINNGNTQDICVLFPEGYTTANQYPVIYYFPGAGESLHDARVKFNYPMCTKLNDTMIIIIDGVHPDLYGEKRKMNRVKKNIMKRHPIFSQIALVWDEKNLFCSSFFFFLIVRIRFTITNLFHTSREVSIVNLYIILVNIQI